MCLLSWIAFILRSKSVGVSSFSSQPRAVSIVTLRLGELGVVDDSGDMKAVPGYCGVDEVGGIVEVEE
jgi:hypothetical protein